MAGYQAMTGTVPGGATGGTLAAINAVGIVGGLQSSKLATVNCALDQIVTDRVRGRGGDRRADDPARGGADGDGRVPPLTAAGAAQMTAYASTTQPSVLSQLQQQTDWMRTAQVLGAFGTGSGTRRGWRST